jgi:ppGpp synthetase/RelA/SpoT-type nucleotidyltranferase
MNIDYTTENNTLTKNITDLLNSNSIEFFIQNRIKTTESHHKKLAKKHDNSYYQITDISGIRIIVNKLSDMRKCIELIINSYKIDYQNSNFNPLSFIDTNEFGYASSHIIIDNNNIKTEVQIRTLSQHIWATTSHNLSYKSEYNDALFERKLFRLSGLLEQIDVLIEDIYESRPIFSDSKYESLKTLDHYSLEYFLSRKERIFSLVNICFERKRTLSEKMQHPFSMKILDGSKAFMNSDKSSMDLILIACTYLKIDTPQKLKDYIINKKSNAKLIKRKFESSNLSSETLSPALRLFLFLIFDIQFHILKEHIKEIVHPKFLENIKAYLDN